MMTPAMVEQLERARQRWNRGGFTAQTAAGETVWVPPSAARPDLGPGIFALAEGRPEPLYFRRPQPAIDVTAQLSVWLRRQLARSKVPAEQAPPHRDPRTIDTVTTDVGVVLHQQVSPVIERLYRQGAITGRQLSAGRQLYDDYEIGVMGARDPDAPAGTGSAEPHLTQLAARHRFDQTRAAMPARLWHLVEAVVIQDQSVAAYAKARGDADDARGWTGALRTALDCLADHLRMPGGEIDPRPVYRRDGARWTPDLSRAVPWGAAEAQMG